MCFAVSRRVPCSLYQVALLLFKGKENLDQHLPCKYEVIEMNQKVILILLANVLTVGICVAQSDQPTITEDFKPSTLNQPGEQDPAG